METMSAERFMGIMILLVLMLAGCAQAATPILSGYETRITYDPGDQYDPAIWDNIIVFTDYRAADTDVYYNDTSRGQEFPVIVAPGNQELTDAARGIIVYTDYRSSDVVVNDTVSGTTTDITAPDKERLGRVFNSVDPATDGIIVAWQDNRDGNNEIYAMDLSNGDERRISNSAVVDSRPAVSDGRIVWQRCVAGGACDIWFYDWASETTTQITNTPSVNEVNPDINGQNVVYQTNVNGNSDIAVYNLNTGIEQVLALDKAQANPHVWGDNVAFDDLSEGLYHISLWNIPSGEVYHLTSGSSGQYLNSIWENRVAYTDDRNGDLEIYMFTFTLTLNEVPVSSCGTISSPGVYVLDTDLVSSSTCIYITSSDVVFDGSSHWMNGTGASNSNGVFVNNPSTTLTNITVRNLKLSDWSNDLYYQYVNNGTISSNVALNSPDGYGILLSASDNSTVSGNTASNNRWTGIYLISSGNSTVSNNIALHNIGGISFMSSRNCTISGNTASMNKNGGIDLQDSHNSTISGNTASNNGLSGFGGYGISLFFTGNSTVSGNTVSDNKIGIALYASSQNNTIYNNNFNNARNYDVNLNQRNAWNITKNSGMNIIGGPYLGGNFWANPGGTGFSQTCQVTNNDGICDLPYVLDTNNIDYLPLTSRSPTTTSITSVPNPSVFGQSVTFTASVSPSSATGTVQFAVDGINVGSPQTVSGGSAAYSTSSLSGGTHGVSALYSGDSSYSTSSGFLSITVQTSSQAIDDLITAVNNLNIPSGNGLTAKLDAAKQSLAKGNQNAAINQLNAFTNQVNAQSGKQLTVAQADTLVAQARAIMNSL